MRFIKRLSFIILFLNTSIRLKAQNSTQHSVWATSSNYFNLSKKTGIRFDVQFRSADDLAYLKNVSVRPGLTYLLDRTKNITLGYTFNFTNSGNISNKNLIEQGIWEQFIYQIPMIKNVQLTNRLRLEQRFIEQNTTNIFSQRLRYFFRSVVPLKKNEDKFLNGAYLAIQNEFFLHLQNKDKLNNHTFDQNRAYLATGYRLNPKTDLEIGYLNQYIKGVNIATTNHVIQLAIYDRF